MIALVGWEFNSLSVPSLKSGLWNTLPIDKRNCATVSNFEHKLSETFNCSEVPTYFYTGMRILSVYQARIRNGCSNLNNDLFNNYLKDNNICQCGNGIEDAEHYFFKCPRFYEQRLTMFRETRQFHPLSVSTLLIGKKDSCETDNIKLFKSVQKYIRDSKGLTSGI